VPGTPHDIEAYSDEKILFQLSWVEWRTLESAFIWTSLEAYTTNFLWKQFKKIRRWKLGTHSHYRVQRGYIFPLWTVSNLFSITSREPVWSTRL
jgi:hypothetical protein